MTYRLTLDLISAVASQAGDVTGRVQVQQSSINVDNSLVLTTQLTAPEVGDPPIAQFNLNFSRLKFLTIKSSAAVEVSLTRTSGGSPTDIWIPIPFRVLHLQELNTEIVQVTQLKLRMNRTVYASAAPATAQVEIVAGGDLNP